MEQDTTGTEKECSEVCCLRGGDESLKQEGRMVEANVCRRERSDQPLVEYLNTESQLHTAGLGDGFHCSFPQKAVLSFPPLHLSRHSQTWTLTPWNVPSAVHHAEHWDQG